MFLVVNIFVVFAGKIFHLGKKDEGDMKLLFFFTFDLFTLIINIH